MLRSDWTVEDTRCRAEVDTFGLLPNLPTTTAWRHSDENFVVAGELNVCKCPKGLYDGLQICRSARYDVVG